MVFGPALRLLGRRLLHLHQVRSDLLAGALTATDVGSRSLHIAVGAAAEAWLLASACDEVLVDVLRLEGLLAAVRLLLDRRSDGERLDHWVADDVRLVEEARVAYHAGPVLPWCVVLLLVVPIDAGRPTPWLAADNEVL